MVAAMTIPTLVANYNQRAWDTGAVVFNRKLEEALKTMNTQSTLAGHTTTESFVEELSKHFKTNKICQNDKLLDCFSETVYWGGGEATPEEVDMTKVKTAKHFGQDDWGTNIVGVQFASGVSALIAYNPLTTGDKACSQDPYSNQITGQSCLAILYDTSGAKNPNSSGKDLRSLNVSKLGGSSCFAEANGVCLAMAPQKPTPHVWNACQSDGTSTDADDLAFMSQYGISKCMTPHAGTNDYWAGAVKVCGGVSKMASKSDLTKLANYIGTDMTKASSLGFDTSQDIYIWTNSETSEGEAYLGYIFPGSSGGYNYLRGTDFPYTVCLGNE